MPLVLGVLPRGDRAGVRAGNRANPPGLMAELARIPRPLSAHRPDNARRAPPNCDVPRCTEPAFSGVGSGIRSGLRWLRLRPDCRLSPQPLLFAQVSATLRTVRRPAQRDPRDAAFRLSGTSSSPRSQRGTVVRMRSRVLRLQSSPWQRRVAHGRAPRHLPPTTLRGTPLRWKRCRFDWCRGYLRRQAPRPPEA